ncbi:MAG: hypothetical protein M3502_06450 [Actinomycetota bacterium]|nr:hypothetical protein [Actinomycetota bacterium]
MAVSFRFLVRRADSSDDNHGLAPILGPIHGAGFLYEVFLAIRGSAERWWGWWFPAVIVVTGGPPGALVGHNRAKREAAAAKE